MREDSAKSRKIGMRKTGMIVRKSPNVGEKISPPRTEKRKESNHTMRYLFRSTTYLWLASYCSPRVMNGTIPRARIVLLRQYAFSRLISAIQPPKMKQRLGDDNVAVPRYRRVLFLKPSRIGDENEAAAMGRLPDTEGTDERTNSMPSIHGRLAAPEHFYICKPTAG